jgi:hypothetical protein
MPKSGEIFVWIGGRFGVGSSSFPAVCPGEVDEANLKNGNLTNYGEKRLNID